MFRAIRQAFERLLPKLAPFTTMDIAPKSTVILPCDPSSILFTNDSPSTSDSATASALETASTCLQRGEAVVFPTETVYGLAASALSAEATSQIFTIKGRPQDN